MIKSQSIRATKKTCFVFIFALVLCASNFLNFSLGNFHFFGQQIGILFTGLLLSFPQSGAAVGIFFLIGIAGFPVFPDFNSGVYTLFYGKNAGYLMGYFFSVIVASYMIRKTDEKKLSLLKIYKVSVIANLILYIFGINHIQKGASKTVLDAINQELGSSRLISDAIKIIFVGAITYLIHPFFDKHINEKSATLTQP
ncbi:MAG: biotin transporter BioY, partial [Treponemataceae bacterium]